MEGEGSNISKLVILVDYDNVEPQHKAAGPVALARLLSTTVPEDVLARHTAILVRLYGGWRERGGNLTTSAQRLIPDIRSGSPCVVRLEHSGALHQYRLTIELADGPLGSSITLQETLARDRSLRKFRARAGVLPVCASPANCGMSPYFGVTQATPCSISGCACTLGDVLIRDEQKMVDTLLVADIAVHTFTSGATDLVVVSSDIDMWPGVLLAVHAGCCITHIHTKFGWRTQGHLMRTLNPGTSQAYRQLTV